MTEAGRRQRVRRLKNRVPYRVRDLLRPTYPDASRPWLQGSFSQAGEDRIVRFLFDMIGVERPTYLDIGAYHPFHMSNTALFYIGGSRGVCVDADPDAVAALRVHRPRDLNLNVGVGVEPGELTFYRMSTPTLNTFDKAVAEQAAGGGTHSIEGTLSVRVRTVQDILTEIDGCPDFLSLDVEGLDLDIVRTVPSWPGRPKVLCVETVTCAGDRSQARKTGEIASVLDRFGYEQHADTWVNGIFIDRDVFG